MIDLGFELDATGGSAKALEAAGIKVRRVNKVYEGRRILLTALKMVSTTTL